MKKEYVDYVAIIKNYRKKYGLSQHDLADLACVDSSTIRAIEKYRANPRLDTFTSILDALNLTIEVVEVK